MLHALREWLTAVVSVSLLLALLRTLTPAGTVRNAASFAGGLALAAVLLRPFADTRLPVPDWDPSTYGTALEEGRAEADRAWQDAVAAEVRTRTEEAVRRKAAELGTVRSVRVTVRTDGGNGGTETGAENGVPLPWTATLSGERDAGLEGWMADALGIPPARQAWTGTGGSLD